MTARSPRSEAIAFRIWAYCERREWCDATVMEIAEALDVSPQVVGGIMRHRGWSDRIRPSAGKNKVLAMIDGSGHDFLARVDDWLDL